MLALGAAAHIADGSDVHLLEARLIVENSDTVLLHHERQRRNYGGLRRVTVVIGILTDGTKASIRPSYRHCHSRVLRRVKGHLNEFQDEVCVLAVELRGQTVQTPSQSVLLHLHQLLTFSRQFHADTKLILPVARNGRQEVVSLTPDEHIPLLDVSGVTQTDTDVWTSV